MEERASTSRPTTSQMAHPPRTTRQDSLPPLRTSLSTSRGRSLSTDEQPPPGVRGQGADRTRTATLNDVVERSDVEVARLCRRRHSSGVSVRTVMTATVPYRHATCHRLRSALWGTRHQVVRVIEELAGGVGAVRQGSKPGNPERCITTGLSGGAIDLRPLS